MKDTVVIIGGHPGTRNDFDWEREDCDVWTFNETLGKNEWCKRADGVFQMHLPMIWRSKTNRNDPKHYDWLQNTDVSVFMLDKYEDVPASVKYPIDEIIEKVLDGDKTAAYFTSSVGYALALAVYKGYKRIEIYGVEMVAKTEYEHQRPGVLYWIGLARGAGITVDMKTVSMFNEPLYGYEGSNRIEVEEFAERAKITEKHTLEQQKVYEQLKESLYADLDVYANDMKLGFADLPNRIAEIGKAAHLYGQWNGGQQLSEFYLKKCNQQIEETGDYFLSDTEYETNANVSAKNFQLLSAQQVSLVNVMSQKVKFLKDAASSKFERREAIKEVKNVLETYISITAQIGAAMGVGAENMAWIDKVKKLRDALGGERAIATITGELPILKMEDVLV